MPHSQVARRGMLLLCFLILLATVSLLVFPLHADAGLSYQSTDDGPGCDGQPDDVGNAPQPGLSRSGLKWLSLAVQWMQLWMSHIGWGGLIL